MLLLDTNDGLEIIKSLQALTSSVLVLAGDLPADDPKRSVMVQLLSESANAIGKLVHAMTEATSAP